MSENKPVGSTTAEGDLMGGDDIILSGSGAPMANGQPTATVQSNQDILAEIFGSSPLTTSQPVPQQQQQQQQLRSTMDDILGLFGSSNTSSSPATSSSTTSPPVTNPLSPLSPNSSSIYSSSPVQSPPTPSAAVPAPVAKPVPRLPAYTAYEKNDLKITLTPQTSAAKPGIVMILAKFTVQNSLGVSGINFQAAVPKVCGVFLKLSQSKNADIDYETIVTTVADASYVKYECGTWSDRDSADADYGARWCKSLFLKNKNLDFLIYIYISQSAVRLRLRISYTVAGQTIQDQVDFSGFPAGLTG